jgi:hypothetical protein
MKVVSFMLIKRLDAHLREIGGEQDPAGHEAGLAITASRVLGSNAGFRERTSEVRTRDGGAHWRVPGDGEDGGE